MDPRPTLLLADHTRTQQVKRFMFSTGSMFTLSERSKLSIFGLVAVVVFLSEPQFYRGYGHHTRKDQLDLRLYEFARGLIARRGGA
jgi:hypothetical protein